MLSFPWRAAQQQHGELKPQLMDSGPGLLLMLTGGRDAIKHSKNRKWDILGLLSWDTKPLADLLGNPIQPCEEMHIQNALVDDQRIDSYGFRSKLMFLREVWKITYIASIGLESNLTESFLACRSETSRGSRGSRNCSSDPTCSTGNANQSISISVSIRSRALSFILFVFHLLSSMFLPAESWKHTNKHKEMLSNKF